MALAYGPIRDEAELEALARAKASAFNSKVEGVLEWWQKAGTENLRVVREDDEVLGGSILIPMGQFFSGRAVPCTGIAGVAVDPAARGRGAATHLMGETLRELRREGFFLSNLYASNSTLYRGVGYERAGVRTCAEVDLAHVPRLSRSERGGRVRRMTADDAGVVEALYRRRAALSNGFLDRGPYIWRRMRSPRGYTAEGFVHEGASGPEGYAILHVPESGFEELVLGDYACDTRAAFGELLATVADYGSLWERLAWPVGAWDPILHELPTRRVKVEMTEQWFLRLVDVPAALAARGWSPVVAGELHLAVEDPIVPENDGAFVLTVADGTARMEPGGEGRLRVPVRSLAALYSGFTSASELARIGALAGDAASLGEADALFLAPAPSMPDFF